MIIIIIIITEGVRGLAPGQDLEHAVVHAGLRVRAPEYGLLIVVYALCVFFVLCLFHVFSPSSGVWLWRRLPLRAPVRVRVEETGNFKR